MTGRTSVALSNPQQPRRIATEQFSSVLTTKWDAVCPPDSEVIRYEGPIHRKQDSIYSQLHGAAYERRIGETAAGGHIDMLAEAIAKGACEIAGARQRMVNPPQKIRQAFAQVTEKCVSIATVSPSMKPFSLSPCRNSRRSSSLASNAWLSR